MDSPAGAFCRTSTCKPDKDKGCTTDDEGCAVGGKSIFWPTKCVRVNFHRYGTQNLDIVRQKVALSKAFASWDEAPCADGGNASIKFFIREDIFCQRVEFNAKGKNVNVVFFRDDDWPYKGIDGTLATTSVSFDKGSGVIQDADIAINAAFNHLTLDEAKPEYDLQSIVVHEVGHFFGLAHSGDGSALMNSTYNPGSVNRALTPDDLAGICAAYPPGRNAPCNDEPTGGYEGDCDVPPDSGGCTLVNTNTGTSVISFAFGLCTLAAATFRRRLFRRGRIQ